MKNAQKREVEKLTLKEMWSRMTTKYIDLVHRGPLLRLLSGKYGTHCNPDESTDGWFVIRLPFSDFCDIMIDDGSLRYLISVRNTLRENYNFDKIVAEVKGQKADLDDVTYRRYTEWLAIQAVLDFLYIGAYDEEENGGVA